MNQKTCKTCKCPIDAGENRCADHEAEFQRWLRRGEGEQDRLDVYQPRRNGVAGVGLDRRTARRGQRRPRPGEELNFDAD